MTQKGDIVLRFGGHEWRYFGDATNHPSSIVNCEKCKRIQVWDTLVLMTQIASCGEPDIKPPRGFFNKWGVLIRYGESYCGQCLSEYHNYSKNCYDIGYPAEYKAYLKAGNL